MKTFCVLAVAVLAIFSAFPAAAATLNGRITAAAAIAAPKALSVAVDSWACAPGGTLEDPALRIGAGRGVADVVVRLKSAAAAPPYVAKAAPVLDQQHCMFVPHVVVVAPEQDLTVKNSDPVLHNFHTLAKANRSVNQSQVKGVQNTFRFSSPEIIPVECDVHYWMSAVVVVADSAWTAVTGDDGSFTIDGVTPGDYTAELWHQRLGTRTTTVHVADAGGRLDVEWPVAPTPHP